MFKKVKINTAISIVFGLLFIVFWGQTVFKELTYKNISKTDLSYIKDKATGNILEKKERRINKYCYSFKTANTPVKFIIGCNINFVIDRNQIKALQVNDSVEFAVLNTDTVFLYNENNEVPIYMLKINGKDVFSESDYVNGKQKQGLRKFVLGVLFLFFLILIFINSNFENVNTKKYWVVFAVLVVMFIILIQYKVV